jgi:hypothetical protein
MYRICICKCLFEGGAISNSTASIGTGATGRNVRSTAFPSAKSKSCSEASCWLGLMSGTRRLRNAFALLEGRFHLASAGQAAADPPRERPLHASEGGRSL